MGHEKEPTPHEGSGTQQHGNQADGSKAPESQDRNRFDFDSFIQRTFTATAQICKSVKHDKDAASIEVALDLLGGAMYALGSIADSLQRIAVAQEGMETLATVDINATIEAGAHELAEELAKKMQADTTKRDFIGKKSIT